MATVDSDVITLEVVEPQEPQEAKEFEFEFDFEL